MHARLDIDTAAAGTAGASSFVVDAFFGAYWWWNTTDTRCHAQAKR
jgi:hypothetical protein